MLYCTDVPLFTSGPTRKVSLPQHRQTASEHHLTPSLQVQSSVHTRHKPEQQLDIVAIVICR